MRVWKGFAGFPCSVTRAVELLTRMIEAEQEHIRKLEWGENNG